MIVDEDRLLLMLEKLERESSWARGQIREACKKASRVIDKAYTQEASAYQYKRSPGGPRPGSKRYKAQEGFSYRRWVKSITRAVRFQSKKTKAVDFFYRSMIRRGTDTGARSVGNLSHLIEDGFVHWRTGRPVAGYKIRRQIFRRNRQEAIRVLAEEAQKAFPEVGW